MRRIATVAAVLAAAGALAFALTGMGGGSGGGNYRVDAIFDNASFLIGGQDVRIAGANVGSVVDVRVTPNNKARVEMSIDPRFGPFRSDADCFIAPQSLIGERFVQCTPGTPSGHVLKASGGHAPTVPLANTHSPVDPDLVVDTYRLPYTQRLSIILNELGVGLAGNGQALNAAIRRANPALQATQDVLRIVDRDRRVLGDLIDRSDVVIGQLARRRDRVASFIQQAADVSQTAGERTGAIAEGIRRLPSSLREARGSLDTLRTLADRSRPLLGDLRRSARPLDRLVADVPPLSAAARPALDHIGRMARVGKATLDAGAPVVKRLRTFSDIAVPVGTLVRQLNESLRDNGVPEGIQTFVMNVALSLARFDSHSHILPSYVVAPPACIAYASTTTPECDAHLVSGPQTATRAAERRARARHHGHRAPAPSKSAPTQQQAPARAPAPATPEKKLLSQLPKLPDMPPPVSEPTKRLLDFLLG